ncbi:MAG: polyhydroxyalkanoate synthesis repressor PhaR, partial [Ignavibacteriales bacterium]
QFGGGMPGADAYQETVRQNLALFDRAMKMFTPFAFPGRAEEAAPAPKPAEAAASDDTLAELRKQMAAMQAQIEKLASKG